MERGENWGEAKTLLGSASLKRVSFFSFPAFEMTQDGKSLARLGRFSLWSVYFGSGQRIELCDGTKWRLRSSERGGVITALIVNSELRKVATATVRHRGYGINGKDFAYDMVSAEKRSAVRSNSWILRELEEDIGYITKNPLAVQALRPVPISGILIAIALAQLGIPGEEGLATPKLNWISQ